MSIIKSLDVLQVRATDQESGETTFTTVTVEVLARGQTGESRITIASMC